MRRETTMINVTYRMCTDGFAAVADCSRSALRSL